MRRHNSTPDTIASLAERCKAHVQHRFGIDLDYTDSTLSLLDHFVREVVLEEGNGKQLPPGDYHRVQLIHLLAPTVGAYFGEVLCRVFPCRWRLRSEAPKDWLVEFEYVPLRFNPAGAAAEALVEKAIASWCGSIDTAPEETEALLERLAAAPPVSEVDFYALTTRFEVLQIAQEWLRCRLDAGEHPPPEYFSKADYDRIFSEGPIENQ